MEKPPDNDQQRDNFSRGVFCGFVVPTNLGGVVELGTALRRKLQAHLADTYRGGVYTADDKNKSPGDASTWRSVMTPIGDMLGGSDGH